MKERAEEKQEGKNDLNSKRAGRKKDRTKTQKEKYEGVPRPGGDFVAPGNKNRIVR
jgi:hypothetical protein